MIEISKKVTLMMLAQIIFIAAVQFAIQQWVIFPSLDSIEKERVKNTLSQITNRLLVEKTRLSQTSYDWSDWSDTYQFLEGEAPEYIDSNLQDESLTAFDFSYLALYDNAMNIVWHREFERVDGNLEALDNPLNASVYAIILNESVDELSPEKIPDARVADGFSRLDDVFIYSIRPVFLDENTPSNGYLMMVKMLDEDALDQMSKELMIPFTIDKVADLLKTKILVTTGLNISLYNEEEIEAFSLMNTDKDNPFLVSATLKPLVIKAGASHARLAMLMLFCSSLFACLVFLVVIQKVIIRRLSSLNDHAHTIINSNNYSLRTQAKGSDEIGTLGSSFDKLLDLVEKEQERLKSFNDKLKKQKSKLETAQSYLQDANQSLEEMALTDSLTGIANRRALQASLEHHWASLSQSQEPISVIMLDVDFFKKFNDLYGHIKGDECLEIIANVLSDLCRDSVDLAVRFGGEEFLLLLPGVSQEVALTISERIQKNIEALKIEHNASSISDYVTVSQGLVTTIPSIVGDSTQLISQADEALYDAKRAGRNNIRVYAS